MRNEQILVLMLFLGIFIASAFAAVTLPSTPPNIVAQTAQKDKAAVVLINSIVTGTAVMPSFTMVEGGTDQGTGTGTIVGTWQSAGETVTFTADGQFVGSSPESGSFSGTYATEGNILMVDYVTPRRTSVQFTFSISGDTLVISNPQIGSFTYTRVGASTTQQSTDVVTNAENLVIVADTGPSAKLLTADLTTGVGGTGFIVSSDGYIVTNAHVVLADQDPNTMLTDELSAQFSDALYSEASQYYNIPEADKEKVTAILTQKFMDYFAQYGQLKEVTVNYYVLNGVAAPGEDLTIKSWPAVVKKEGTVYEKIEGQYTWGRDIAIIKVDKTNLPTVTLGDSDQVQVGDSIFVIGYPDTAAGGLFKPSSALEATVTQGVVSAKRTLQTGVEAIQTDAAINHGNSGGPVYNDKGEVIGIATFGAGPETGIEAIKFMMPINLAKDFMKELNVQNQHSVLDTDYSDGLNAFWNRDCYTAISKMQQVLTIYPAHPYAQDYITECQRAINAGEVSKPIDYGLIAIIGGALLIIGIVVVAGVVLILVIRRRSGHKEPKQKDKK